MEYKYFYESEIGWLEIKERDGKIVEIHFCKDNMEDQRQSEKTPLIEELIGQLEEYFQGKRKTFNIPIDPKGTDFQKSVWRELVKIPYGETCSYGYIAKKINNPKAARAIGMANNRNPISIIIPCHRVIGASGKLVGYGGGLDIKEKLLNLEKENI